MPRWLHPFLLLALLAGCAPDHEAEAGDPFERSNRALYGVHHALDQAVLKPAAEGYREVVPFEMRMMLRNLLANLRAPVVLANDLLQGQGDRGGETAARFLINSTLGIGGLFDVAGGEFGIPRHTEDFGQTFAVWGAGPGPYVCLPLLGPSNARDLAGFALGVVADPFFWLGQGAAVDALAVARVVAIGLDTRESLLEAVDQLERSSLDPYAAIRSAYGQQREAEIANRNDRR